MKLVISNNSAIPIYEQIKKAIIKDIMEQDLKSNELLPSIRSLAQDIRISVMTVKKAYDELEKEGYINVVQGKGCYVAPQNSNLLKEHLQREIEKNLEMAIDIAKKNNIQKEELIDLITILYGDDENE